MEAYRERFLSRDGGSVRGGAGGKGFVRRGVGCGWSVVHAVGSEAKEREGALEVGVHVLHRVGLEGEELLR